MSRLMISVEKQIIHLHLSEADAAQVRHSIAVQERLTAAQREAAVDRGRVDEP
jgi:hypothetical protein